MGTGSFLPFPAHSFDCSPDVQLDRIKFCTDITEVKKESKKAEKFCCGAEKAAITTAGTQTDLLLDTFWPELDNQDGDKNNSRVKKSHGLSHQWMIK